MQWPDKTTRENIEINAFIKAYAQLPELRKFEVVSKGERPDYVVRNGKNGEEFGVELTSVYSDDKSVPNVHMCDEEGPVEIPFDPDELEKYKKRLINAVNEKVRKARNGYDLTRPLILSIYVNEYISIYLDEPEPKEFINGYEDVFDKMAPFSEIVFWNLNNNGVLTVKPG